MLNRTCWAKEIYVLFRLSLLHQHPHLIKRQLVKQIINHFIFKKIVWRTLWLHIDNGSPTNCIIYALRTGISHLSTYSIGSTKKFSLFPVWYDRILVFISHVSSILTHIILSLSLSFFFFFFKSRGGHWRSLSLYAFWRQLCFEGLKFGLGEQFCR